jgi:hypothetical protein
MPHIPPAIQARVRCCPIAFAASRAGPEWLRIPATPPIGADTFIERPALHASHAALERLIEASYASR